MPHTHTHSHSNPAPAAAHDHSHDHGHVHGASAPTLAPAGSWLLRAALWRVGVAVGVCALLLAVVAWAMTVQG